MDGWLILLLTYSMIIMGAFYTIFTATNIPKLAEIANVYVFFLIASAFLMLIYMQITDDESLSLPHPIELIEVGILSFMLPLIVLSLQILFTGSIYYNWFIPVIKLPKEAIQLNPTSLVILEMAKILGMTPSTTMSILYNIVVGTAETALFQAFLPQILNNLFEKTEIPKEVGFSLSVFLSSLLFAILHLVYQKWGGFFFALISGLWITGITQQLAMKYDDITKFPWSAPCLAHSFYNISVILLTS